MAIVLADHCLRHNALKLTSAQTAPTPRTGQSR